MTISHVGDDGQGASDQPAEHAAAIRVNGQTFLVHRGAMTVADIKKTGGVPLADDLEQVIAGKLTPLPDSGTVTIRGDEMFVSHPKDSKSS